MTAERLAWSYSGTEAKARVLIDGPDPTANHLYASDIKETLIRSSWLKKDTNLVR